jgi:hypothetical protein
MTRKKGVFGWDPENERDIPEFLEAHMQEPGEGMSEILI